MKILIVEDEKNTRNALAECVRGFGFHFERILLAENGCLAFKIFEAERPEIVITDIRMPGGSGMELAEQIYRMDGNTAIIFLTAYSELEFMKEAIHVSAVDYILKPVSISELRLAIRKAMEKTNSFARKNTVLLQEIFFRNLLIDGQSYSRKEYRQIQRELGLPDERFRFVLFAIENLSLEEYLETDNISFDMSQLGRIIRKGLENFLFLYSFIHSSHRILTVCGMERELSQKKMEEAGAFLGTLIYEEYFEKAVIKVGKIKKELFQLKDVPSEYIEIQPAYPIHASSDKKSITQRDKIIVEKINQLIAANYEDSELKVNDMAKQLCYTSAYLCMIYKKVTGITINDALNLYRIDKSRRLLIDDSLKMAEIAARTGYSNENYFSKVFKKYEGVSPKEYRTKRWEG